MATVWIDSVQNAHEGVQQGYFRVMRDDTVGLLNVNYVYDTANSTATNGYDFPYLSGTASIEDGQQYTDIPVIPTS